MGIQAASRWGDNRTGAGKGRNSPVRPEEEAELQLWWRVGEREGDGWEYLHFNSHFLELRKLLTLTDGETS